jgi:TPR repeat protein
MYENGQGVKKDLAKAWKYFKQSADKGWSEAIHHMGEMYENGTSPEGTQLPKAAHLYKVAAEMGHLDAMTNYGNLLLKGKGVEKNEKLAAEWISKAAEKGHSKALNLLGYLYYHGIGVEKDPERAVRLFMKSANLVNMNTNFFFTSIGKCGCPS